MYDTEITRCCGHLRTSTLARHRLPAIVDPIVHVVVRLRWIDMGMSIDSGQQVQWWWWLGGIAVLIMDSALLLIQTFAPRRWLVRTPKRTTRCYQIPAYLFPRRSCWIRRPVWHNCGGDGQGPRQLMWQDQATQPNNTPGCCGRSAELKDWKRRCAFLPLNKEALGS